MCAKIGRATSNFRRDRFSSVNLKRQRGKAPVFPASRQLLGKLDINIVVAGAETNTRLPISITFPHRELLPAASTFNIPNTDS